MQLSLVDILSAAPSTITAPPPPLDIHRIIHYPLPRWITKCHTCQIGVENGCPAEHNSQPCHELPTSAPIARCLPSLPAHCFVPTLVLPSAQSLLESDERQPGSSLLQHASACKSVLIISPTYAAIYSSLVRQPARSRHYRIQEGEMCACVDSHVGDSASAIISVYASAACVCFCFFMRK